MRHAKKAPTNWVQGSKTASRKRLYGKDLVHADGSPATADSTRPTMTTSTLGRRAVVCHVASYTAVQLGATVGITRAFGYRVTPTALLAGAAINAGTHAAIDRGAFLLWDPGELHLMQARPLAAGPELQEVYRLAA
ncbi:hypothetical protein KVH31_36420 [Streptomyces olivaceus]|uniref:hypothetical protein n=1 Tax=Streptomyces olivaceus TaxID=47716 RepID=UPI001CCB87D7|nr:hypothetical protein [Streptomyces olivaceus]MBZ6211985.1 hypothetical protein [Streptomyces olivaceus]